MVLGVLLIILMRRKDIAMLILLQLTGSLDHLKLSQMQRSSVFHFPTVIILRILLPTQTP